MGSPLELPPLVERTVQRLIRAFAPEQVIVFGSYAKGARGERSDVDVLVITELDAGVGGRLFPAGRHRARHAG
jgi:predicted nucleotidyltransferase